MFSGNNLDFPATGFVQFGHLSCTFLPVKFPEVQDSAYYSRVYPVIILKLQENGRTDFRIVATPYPALQDISFVEKLHYISEAIAI